MKKLIALFIVGFSLTTQNATAQLMAGTARVNITPRGNEPVHDSVYARILVLQSGQLRFAFVSVDLAVFTSERIEKTRS